MKKVIVSFKNPDTENGLPKVEIECTYLDSNDPELQTKLRSSKLYYKKVIQKGRLALHQEKIETPTDGTFKIAQPGNIIFLDEKSGEQYAIENSTFQMKYKLKNPDDQSKFENGEWVMIESFKSPETYVNAIQVNEDIAITAPWGEIQGVRKGGYLVSPVNKPEIVWCVDKESFDKTYFEVYEII